MRRLKKAVAIALVFATGLAFSANAQSKKPEAPKAPQKKGDVYTAVDTAPSFPGGLDAFGKYLASAVKYPAADRQNNVQGKVFITFIVEPNGKVSNVKAVRGPSKTLIAEGVRVMKASPKWVAGKQKGKPVRVEFTVPINFVMNES